MKVYAEFTELEALIEKKAGRKICLQKVEGGNTVKVTYTMVVDVPLIGKVEKDVEADITINGIREMELDLTYSLPTGLGLVAKGIKAFLGKKIEESHLLKWGEQENQVILFVDKLLEKLQVEGVDRVAKIVKVTDICIQDKGLEVSAPLQVENL